MPKRQALCWELWKQLDKDKVLVLKELSLHVLDEPVLQEVLPEERRGCSALSLLISSEQLNRGLGVTF